MQQSHLHQLIAKSRRSYKALVVETVNEHGLLYTWRGIHDAMKPLLFMAHSDVGHLLLGNSLLPNFS